MKVGPDRLTDSQRAFVDSALSFHRLAEFTIIEVAVPGPSAIAATRQARWS